jgi:hypothetical protein
MMLHSFEFDDHTFNKDHLIFIAASSLLAQNFSIFFDAVVQSIHYFCVRLHNMPIAIIPHPMLLPIK